MYSTASAHAVQHGRGALRERHGRKQCTGPRWLEKKDTKRTLQHLGENVSACRHRPPKAEVEAARTRTAMLRNRDYSSQMLMPYWATIAANYLQAQYIFYGAGRRRTKMKATADAHAPSKKTGGYPTWPATIPASGPANPNPMSTKATYAPIAAPLF